MALGTFTANHGHNDAMSLVTNEVELSRACEEFLLESDLQ